jgi:hypothetical protein
VSDLPERTPSTSESGTPGTHQTLSPEVEEALGDIEKCSRDYEGEARFGCCVDRIYNHLDEADLLRRHLTAQAEEIERLIEWRREENLERDRYKAMAEWLAEQASEVEDIATQLAQADVETRSSSPSEWLKAAEEATDGDRRRDHSG